MTDGLGLGDAFGATLDRITGQGGERARLGMAALMWISHSERALKADELCHALAVEIGSSNLDADNVPSIGLLLACCQGLAAVEKEASTVRLIHFTVQEYLRARPELFGSVQSIMAETCLSYLNSNQVKAVSPNSYSNFRSTPFLEYSSVYWGIHAKRKLSDRAKLLALKLFGRYNNHISIKILLEEQALYGYWVDFNNTSLFTGLHCASFFGIVDIVARLLEVGGYDINQEDCVGYTPLLWGARNGHDGVVEILLKRDDVDPDMPDELDRTPLYWAVRNGHERMVRMLLELDAVNPNELDMFGQTALSCAALNGHEGVVKMLLGRDDVDPDEPDGCGQTPLSCAAWNGHEGVVKMLFRRDGVNPNQPDTLGRTPLWHASKRGHAGVMALLQPVASATLSTT